MTADDALREEIAQAIALERRGVTAKIYDTDLGVADAILPIVARVEQEAYRRGQAEAWERGYMFAFAQERGDYTHSRPVPDYIAEDIRSWNPYITEETP